MRIRTMIPDDYPAALALWQGSDGVTVRGADRRAEITRFLAHNPGMSFVAENAQGLVGTILAGTDGRRGYIHHAAVAEGFRGQGIGRALVEAATGALTAAGIRKVHAFVLTDNADGLAFWRALGWQLREDFRVMSALFSDDPNA